MFSKLSSQQLTTFLPFFQSKPKLALFGNAAKFQLEERLPNHPCDFYYLHTNNSKYFYVFRHDLIPDSCRPILMIGSDQTVIENDVIFGLEQIKLMEPDLGKIELLVATSELSIPARKFFIDHFDLREDFNVACNNFYLPSSVYSEIQSKTDAITLPPSFSIGSTQLSNSEIVNSTWKFATAETILQIKEIIKRLPTSCIFHQDKPVAFEMIGLHGQLNHQYTFPEYRNRGFGGMIENSIVSKCFREGIQVVKSVELSNKEVLKRSLEHQMWKVVRDENEEILVFDYTQYH
uniref:Glycine N-acyltransferase-like protein n=1 Tax=Caenorhabditis tropicalis TaxID=1561998 RepID=A0A1I7TDV5_9PELO